MFIQSALQLASDSPVHTHTHRLMEDTFFRDTLTSGPRNRATDLQLVDDSALPSPVALFNNTLSTKEQAVLCMCRDYS